MTTTYPIGTIDLYRTLKPLAFFPSDPTVELSTGRFARATRTPDGPATISVSWDDGTARVDAWGDGARWLLDRGPELLGLDDDISDFDPGTGVVRSLWSRYPGLRITASHTLWHDVAWLIPGQRVATSDAARHWKAIVNRWSEPAPGPVPLRLPPRPADLAKVHYTELHRCGLERKRAEHLRSAARTIPRFERRTDVGSDELRRLVETVPGLGRWTSTNVVTMTAGDPDGVVLDDYGLPSSVTWALARERVGTDQRMLDLLEPYRPHRWRVCRLIMSSRLRPPRHGPRLRNPRIERL